MGKIRMIIDCDTGVDDALAIAYILANRQIDLIGITAVFGNVDVDLSARNSLLISELFGKKVPVYKGADHALEKGPYVRHPKSSSVHGDNGIGNVDLGEPKGRCEEGSAIDFILDSARKYKEDLHLVFVGPLTNLALCIDKDEEALRSVGNITIMGGALTIQGNKSVYAEANIGNDPLAAAKVFGSSLHLSIIPLDVTLKTLFRVHDIDGWKGKNHAGKSLYEIARFYYVNELREKDENAGGAMHDPLAAYASYDPSIITNWFSCNVTAEDNGRMIGTFRELNLPEKRHKVALDVDAKHFTQQYIDLVSGLIDEV